jgi:hypothetical protein
LDVIEGIPVSFAVDKVIVLIEGCDMENGDTRLWWTASEGVMSWQALGIMEAAMAAEKETIAESFKAHDDDEGDD